MVTEFQSRVENVAILCGLCVVLLMYIGTAICLYRDTRRRGFSRVVTVLIVFSSLVVLSALWVPVALAWLIFGPEPHKGSRGGIHPRDDRLASADILPPPH